MPQLYPRPPYATYAAYSWPAPRSAQRFWARGAFWPLRGAARASLLGKMAVLGKATRRPSYTQERYMPRATQLRPHCTAGLRWGVGLRHVFAALEHPRP